ncbi:MAG: hypothetical protein V4689_08415 [Verrucomicrobiota bacterium]
MKTLFQCLIASMLLGGSWVSAQVTYTNFIRQVQFPSGLQKDVSVTPAGQQPSDLAIDPGGARFELWTVPSTLPLTSYLLETRYVGTYIPLASVAVRSEDNTSSIVRTRADRPYYVDVVVSGLLSGATDPEPSKSVKFLRHVQSYGAGGTGVGIDRTQAILLTQTTIATNGTQNLTFLVNSVPGANRAKVRGEERFSIFSLEDYQAPESQLASQFIQIWPVADGTISGIASNQLIQFSLPTVTLTLNDLYPSSTTYAQVYKGNPVLGTTGKIVPGSSLVINDSVPQSRVLSLTNYDTIFDSDGRWTMELLTKTPFGIDRLGFVSFDLDRTIQMNGSFTTIE